MFRSRPFRSPRALLGALEEREFRLLFLGQAISAFGDRMLPVAMAFAVLDLTNSAADLGLVLAATTIPMVVLVLVGGVFADRLPRQKVMLASDLVRALAEGTTALLLLTGSAHLWNLIALGAVFGTADAFFGPASTGLVPQTVSPARLQQANALLGLSRSATGILGPSIAGILVATVGPGSALGVDAATFVASAWFLARLRLPARARTAALTFLAELRAGWDEFRCRSWMWASVTHFAFLHVFVLAPFFVLGPFVAKRSLGGAAAWATILTAAGVGSILGGALGLRWQPRRLLAATFLVLFGWVPQLVLLGLAAPAPAIAAAAFFGATAMSLSGTFWSTAMQEHVPAEAISRVSAYDWLGSLLFAPVGYVLAGPLAAAIGLRATLWLAAGWLAFANVAVLAVPGVRNLRRIAHERAPAVPVTQV